MTPTLDRRSLTLGLSGLILSACSSRLPRSPAPAAASPEYRPVPNAGWDAWVDAFQGRAASQGISDATLSSAFRGAGFLPQVIERDRNQTEFNRTLEDYLAIAASDERVQKGRANYARYRSTFDAIEQRYGVEPHVVAAIWGLESMYGERKGDVPVVSALSTLAYEGRRASFFESQLIAALKILQNGDIPAAQMTGSWAGAMGHTQFIPTSYLAYAVDFTGDGRRDIWSTDPSDALASTASYLSRSGWTRGQPWGQEVTAGNAAEGGRVLTPQPGGPSFRVTSNFNVIKRYNNSDSYAIGVGHLADRIAGAGPLKTSFGPDANGMTIEDRQEMQRLLTASGFDAGGSDGVIGPKTTAAITAYQGSRGVAVTGEPSLALLGMLRRRA